MTPLQMLAHLGLLTCLVFSVIMNIWFVCHTTKAYNLLFRWWLHGRSPELVKDTKTFLAQRIGK